LSIAAGLFLLSHSITFGQEAPPTAQATDRSGVTIEEVIVTGSNIPTSEEVGPNPVDTYRPEDIARLGARTSTDFVQRLPAVMGTALNENNSNRDGRAEINLRGLFPKETLVLIDGKRLAPVGFAHEASIDVNLIPFALVDHIDILKDGASAIYGSDAVAGVFNVFLNHKFRGLEIEASLGNTNLGSSNDAAEREAHLLAGTGDDKTDIVVFAEYYDRAAIFSRDRDLSSTADFRKFGGGDNRSGSFAGRVGGFVLRPGVRTPAPHSAPNAANSPEYVPLFSLPIAKQKFDFASLLSAIPAADREYFYGSFTRELCDKYLTLFADFKVGRTFFEPTLAPVPFVPDPFKQADRVTTVTPGGQSISVPLTNPFNPFTEPDSFLPDGTPVTTGVRYRALEAGPRPSKYTTYDYLFDAGVRGTLAEFGDYFKTWNYEIGFRYNSNWHTKIASGLVSQPGLRAALLDTDPLTAFNPFGRNVNTTAALNRVLATTQQNGVATLTDESVALNGSIINMPAGPLSFALGSEHRKETVNDQPDVLNTSFSSIGSVDFQATRASRDVWSYYGELRIPITSPSWKFPGAHSLEFQVAERVEFYSDTNLSERPKFSVRYQPFDSSLTLRAGYTEAFHAPNLSDLAPSASEGFFDVFDPATGAGPSVRLLEGGQPNLRPEVAYGFNYGAVWTPKFIRGLTLSADFYHIDLRDRTNFIDPQFIIDENFASGGKRFPGQVVRDPGTGQILFVRRLIQNISRTITEGIDYEAIYVLDTTIFGKGNFGTFTFTLNGNYLSRYVAAINVGDRELEYSGEETFFGGYFPHNRFYASAFYDLGGLDAGVTVHYIGQGSDGIPLVLPPHFVPRKIREWTTVDAIVSYTFNLSSPMTENQVAGYAKDGGKNANMKDGKEKSLVPVSTAQYNSCGWRAWVNGTTITAGMNNIFDLDPPFAAGAFGNGYEESTYDIKGRFWYVSLKKRF
jgi:iron complex outermembrane receptor protein